MAAVGAEVYEVVFYPPFRAQAPPADCAEAVFRSMDEFCGHDTFHVYRVVLGGVLLRIDHDRARAAAGLEADMLVVLRACVADALLVATCCENFRRASRAP